MDILIVEGVIHVLRIDPPIGLRAHQGVELGVTIDRYPGLIAKIGFAGMVGNQALQERRGEHVANPIAVRVGIPVISPAVIMVANRREVECRQARLWRLALQRRNLVLEAPIIAGARAGAVLDEVGAIITCDHIPGLDHQVRRLILHAVHQLYMIGVGLAAAAVVVPVDKEGKGCSIGGRRSHGAEDRPQEQDSLAISL